MVPDGADSQRGWSGRHQVREDQWRILRLGTHVPELGLTVDMSNEVEWRLVVHDHNERRTDVGDAQLRGQWLALRANVGGLQLPVIIDEISSFVHL